MIINAGRTITDYLIMCKLKIMLPVSLTGFTGFFLFDPSFSANIFIVTFGILLMAISASVLNQLQEIDIDNKMERTKNRPLPSGRISRKGAFIFFLITLCAGAVFIYSAGNMAAMLTGLFTVIWYNGIYTPLKKKTAFAVIPGALTGAMPPLIGWVAAGGSAADPSIVTVMLLFFTGQIPHFSLLVLKYGEQYRKAGVPVMTTLISPRGIERMIFLLVSATAIISLFFSLAGVISSTFVFFLILLISFMMIILFYPLTGKEHDTVSLNRYSVILNMWFLLIMILIISDKLVSSYGY